MTDSYPNIPGRIANNRAETYMAAERAVFRAIDEASNLPGADRQALLVYALRLAAERLPLNRSTVESLRHIDHAADHLRMTAVLDHAIAGWRAEGIEVDGKTFALRRRFAAIAAPLLAQTKSNPDQPGPTQRP